MDSGFPEGRGHASDQESNATISSVCEGSGNSGVRQGWRRDLSRRARPWHNKPPPDGVGLPLASGNECRRTIRLPTVYETRASGVRRNDEDIVFKLPGKHSAFHPPPPPKLTLDDFRRFQRARPVTNGPPEVRKWVLSQMRNDWTYSFQAKRRMWKGLPDALPAKMVQVPTSVRTSRIYIIIDDMPSPTTGATEPATSGGLLMLPGLFVKATGAPAGDSTFGATWD